MVLELDVSPELEARIQSKSTSRIERLLNAAMVRRQRARQEILDFGHSPINSENHPTVRELKWDTLASACQRILISRGARRQR